MLKQFQVIARPLPTEATPNPPAVRVQVFAQDEVIAKSRFWSVARRIARMKKSSGEVLSVQQVIEPEPTRAKTYGVWLSFKSKHTSHNVYKEYRDTTTEGAVQHMYQEMAGTHNCKTTDISIIKVAEVANEDVRHKTISQFVHEGIKYPILKQSIRPACPSQRKILSKTRPTICGF